MSYKKPLRDVSQIDQEEQYIFSNKNLFFFFFF